MYAAIPGDLSASSDRRIVIFAVFSRGFSAVSTLQCCFQFFIIVCVGYDLDGAYEWKDVRAFVELSR